MGINIDLEKVNYNKFVNKLMENPKINDKELLEQIILEFGNHIGEELIVLENEYYEDGHCAWNMCQMIQEVFNLDIEKNYDEDCIYAIFYDMQEELIGYKEIDKAYENLKIERKEKSKWKK